MALTAQDLENGYRSCLFCGAERVWAHKCAEQIAAEQPQSLAAIAEHIGGTQAYAAGEQLAVVKIAANAWALVDRISGGQLASFFNGRCTFSTRTEAVMEAERRIARGDYF